MDKSSLKLKPILYVADSTGFGGAERYLEDVVSHFKQQTTVKLLLLGKGCPELEERMHSLSIEVIGVGNGKSNLWHLWKVLFVHQSWLVHVNLTHYDSCRWVFILSYFLPFTKLVATMHALVPKLSFGIAQRVKEVLFNRYDVIIAPSHYAAITLIDTRHVQKHKIRVIFNGVPEIGYTAQIGEARPLTLLCLGRLDIDKGYQYLIEGMSMINRKYKWQCVIVGDGPYKNELINLAKEMNQESRVHFVGFQKNVIHSIQSSDVLVLPSLNENFPLTILEVMSAGKPVIASRVGGIPEQVVDGATGILVDPANSEQLSRAIEQLIENPNIVSEMGQAGMNRYNKEFRLDNMLQQLQSLYHDLN